MPTLRSSGLEKPLDLTDPRTFRRSKIRGHFASSSPGNVSLFGVPKIEEQAPKTIDGLKDAIRELRWIIRALLKSSKLSNNKRHDRIFRNLLTYIDVQLSRMLVRKSLPVDLMALATRNLIEVALWCQFITTSKENLRQFDDEVMIDLVDLFRFVDPSSENYPSLEQRVKRLMVSGKFTLLEKTSKSDKFWFKICSKMIHPTAWSINLLLGSSNVDYYRLELSAYALKCATRAVSSLTGWPLPTYIES